MNTINIKIIYSKKVHKLPQQADDFDKIVAAIKQLYPKIKKVFLWASLDQYNPNLQQIQTQQDFNQVKLQYLAQSWPTLKLLVTDTLQAEQTIKESWGLLNQSVLPQGTLKNNDVAIQSNPHQADQAQQFAPNLGNQGTQAKVASNDGCSNTNPTDYSTNEQLVALITRLIDERLQFHGIAPNQFAYQADANNNFKASTGEVIQWAITLKNTGKQAWNNAFLKCNELNFTIDVGNVMPGESRKLNATINVPKVFGVMEFKFILYTQDKIVGEPIKLTINIAQSVFKDANTQKAEILHSMFPQRTMEFMKKFIVEKGKNKTVEELTELILAQL